MISLIMGMELVEEILSIYENYQFETEVIVACIRHPGHVVEAAAAGRSYSYRGLMP
jgi:transaldolase